MFWFFHNMFNLLSRLLSTDFGTRSYQCSLTDFTPVYRSLHPLSPLIYFSLANIGNADMMCSTVPSESLQSLQLFIIIGRIHDSITCMGSGYLRLSWQCCCCGKWLKLLNTFSNNFQLSLTMLLPSSIPVGGFKPPTLPKFRSFDKVEPDCNWAEKCLVFLFQHPNYFKNCWI